MKYSTRSSTLLSIQRYSSVQGSGNTYTFIENTAADEANRCGQIEKGEIQHAAYKLNSFISLPDRICGQR